jgi:hypothetical protein
MNPEMMALTGSLFIVISFIYIYFSSLLFKREEKKKFSFLNGFPFELVNRTVLFLSIMVLAGLSAIFYIYFFYSAFFILNQPLTLLISLITSAMMVSWIFLLIVSPLKTKPHLLLSSIFMVLNTSLSSIITYYLVVTPYEKYPDYLPFITGLIFIVQIILLINPRVKNWAILEKKEDNGQIEFLRPKVFVLALYEWLFFLLSFFLLLAVLISSIK